MPPTTSEPNTPPTTSAPTNPGSGGGGGGGFVPPSDSASVEVSIQNGTATVSVTNAKAGQSITIESGVTGDGAGSPQLNSLNLAFSEDVSSTSMSVSGSRREIAPVNAEQDLGYFTIDHDFTSDQVTDVTFDFTVNRDNLEARNVAPEDVVLYRYSEGEWTALEASQSGSTETAYQFEAVSPELSTFAVSTAQAQQTNAEIMDASIDTTAIETGGSNTATATVENTGSASGTFTIPVTVNGETVDEKTVELDGGEQTTVSFTQTVDEAGDYEIGIGDATAGTVSVTESTSQPTTTMPDSETGGGGINLGLVVLVVLLIAALAAGFVYWRRNTS